MTAIAKRMLMTVLAGTTKIAIACIKEPKGQ